MNNFIFRRDEIQAFQIKESEIMHRCTHDTARRAEMLIRKNILKDNLEYIIDAQLRLMFTPQTYDDMRHYVDATNNLMRRVVRETSTVYKGAPERVVSPKGGQKRFDEVCKALNLNQKMKRANYLLNGMNDLLVQVVVMDGMIDLSLLTPDMVTVFENKDNPTVLDAVLIEDAYCDEVGQTQRQWIYWSPTRHFILDRDFKTKSVDGNPEMVNPYAEQNILMNTFFPFVPIHKDDRENCFWDRYTGKDLVSATKLVALQSTFRNFMIPMQFKQLGVKQQTIDTNTGTTKSNQIKSPLDILVTNGEAQVLDWQSNLTQIGEQIEKQIFSVAGNHGISSENFKLMAQSVSGFARKVARERLDEIREDQTETWRDAEDQIFEAIKWASIVYNLNPLPEAAKLSVDFAEPKDLEDPKDEMDLKIQKIDLGVVNLLDVIMEENPDIKTEEDAEAFLQRNIDIKNRMTNRYGINFDAALLNMNGAKVQRGQTAPGVLNG